MREMDNMSVTYYCVGGWYLYIFYKKKKTHSQLYPKLVYSDWKKSHGTEGQDGMEVNVFVWLIMSSLSFC